MGKNTGYPVIICDKDHIIAASGVSKKEYVGRRISHSLEELMEQRKNFILTKDKSQQVLPVEGLERSAVTVNHIITSGDIMGAVIMLENDSGTVPGEVEIKLADVCSGFLGKQMED